MDLGLKGLNAIITGGSKGIGRRAADIFADEGANVSVCARNLAEVNETATSLAQKGVKSLGRMVNVAEKASLEGWIRESAAALGGIDIVVANVSALAVGDNEDAWKSGFDVDIMHTVRLVNTALPLLEKS
ncbi:MAG: SDR family NAD(P)-dependent oxidoreductase, partial [Pseudomonadota bacterium]